MTRHFLDTVLWREPKPSLAVWAMLFLGAFTILSALTVPGFAAMDRLVGGIAGLAATLGNGAELVPAGQRTLRAGLRVFGYLLGTLGIVACILWLAL